MQRCLAGLMIGLLGSLGLVRLAAADCMKWVLRTDVGGPGPQTRHCMTYNSDRQRVVLFTSDDAADLWEYDGVRWDRVFVVGPRPSARVDSAIAYDRRRHELVLVGGYGRAEQTELADTWTCVISTDATGNVIGAWTQRQDFPGYAVPDDKNPEIQKGESGARSEHSLVYDVQAGVVRLFGGKARIVRGERWQNPYNRENYSTGSGAWTGTAWVDRRWSDPRAMINPDPDSPPAIGKVLFRHELGRKQIAASYDLQRGRIITYGGLRQIYQRRSLDTTLPNEDDEAYIESLPHLQYLSETEGFPSPSRHILSHSSARCGQADKQRVYGAQLVHDLRRDRYVAFGGGFATGEPRGGAPCARFAGVNTSEFQGEILSSRDNFIEWDPNLPRETANFNYQLPDFDEYDEGIPDAPTARIDHRMVYDERRGVTVVYGGWDATPGSITTMPRETWEYSPALLDFLEQPAALSETCLGETLTLSVIPLASSNPEIQWYKGTQRIDGATNRTLTLTSITRADAGTYGCDLMDPCRNRVSSRAAVVRVGGPPVITAEPAAVHVCPGETAETQFFFDSDYPATIEWFQVPVAPDGNASVAPSAVIPGADSNRLRIAALSPADNGFYRARVSNRCGIAWTQPVEITAGVWLRVEPRDTTNNICDATSLNLLASGKGAISYRWRRNGEPLTNSTRILSTDFTPLTINRLHYLDDASYDCVVSDACHSVTSRVARLVALPNPPFVFTDTQGPAGRSYHQMAFDSRRGQTVLFGGLIETNTASEAYRNDTWEYDGTRWMQRFPANSPSSRINFGMSFDRDRGRMVLFGGATNNEFSANHNNETWEYDGTNWTQRFPAHSPAPRINPALFYDPVNRVTTLYGGDTTLPNPRAGDIWVWDGTDWRQRIVTGDRPLFGGQYGSPVRPQMAWDVARGYAVLPPTVDNESGSPFRVTWTWDGARWTRHPYLFQGFELTPPQAGSGGGIAYDTYRREVIYWGGDGYDQTSLWRWTGSHWQRDPMDELVGFHINTASAYDERRQALVQFGGRYSGSQRELWGQFSRTFERVLADEPVLLRAPIVLNDPATNLLFLRIVAAGAPPLTYEWQRDGVRISEAFPYQGTTNDTLALDRVLASDTGLYRCVVRGRCGETFSPNITVSGQVMGTQMLQAIQAPVTGQLGLRLTWESPTSVLEEAVSLRGPWIPIPDATSPYEIQPSGRDYFFRLAPTP